MERRMVLKMMAGGSVAALTFGAGYGAIERQETVYDTPDLGDRSWLANLGRSLAEEKDARPQIEGEIPAGLRGTLYRNGPGLFERGDDRKRHLLDGDGLIRCWNFTDEGVRFRTRFVRTDKFVEEEKAGKLIHPTWTTVAPKWWNGVGANMKSQAGITPVIYDGRLLAIDEVGLPWELDPETLETRGEYRLADEHKVAAFKAHTKIDGTTGDLIALGNSFGRAMVVHAIVRGKDGALKSYQAHEAPRNAYFHDFFATKNHIIAHLQPLQLPTIPVSFLAGVKSFTDSLTYDAARGTVLMVMDKAGKEPPRFIEVPGCFMWHSLNAYEQGNEIIADFVGYDDPVHAFSDHALFKTLMQGKNGDSGAPGTFRRYVIDLESGTGREDLVSDGQYEFPIVNWTLSNHRHRFGYVASGKKGDFFHTGVSRIDVESGAETGYDFGPGHYVGEPVFAPKPGQPQSADAAADPAWILCEVHHAATGTTRLAILDAEALADGPVAQVLLDHHLPISFHGWWHEA